MARYHMASLRYLVTGPPIPVLRHVDRYLMSRHRLLVACAFALMVPVSAAALPVRAMFVEARQKEQAVRAALADPAVSATVLKSVRRTVASYESVVRRYPTSSYSDDALWQAGRLALDVFGRFGDVKDRETGLRLLHWLAAEYPTSKLAKQVPGVLTAIERGSQDARSRKSQSAGHGASSPAPLDAGNAPGPAPGKGSSLQNAAHAANAGSLTVAAPKTTSITTIQRSLLSDVVRVTIALDAEVAFHDERIAGPSRIFIDFPATRATESLLDRTLRFDEDRDLVRQVRIGSQPNAATRIVLDATGISSYSVYPIYNPFRLVIDCVRAAPPAAPLSAVRLKADTTTDPVRANPDLKAASVRTTPDPVAESARTKPIATRDPVRPTLPIAGHAIGGTSSVALPSAAPGAAAILEAARMPTILSARTVKNDWGRRLPNASPTGTAAILEARRASATLASRPLALALSRNLPGASPAETAAILEARRASAILTSRPLATASSRNLPKGSPAATAAILDATRVSPTLMSHTLANTWGHSLPSASSGTSTAISAVLASAARDSASAAVAADSPASPPSPVEPPAPGLGSGFSMARQLGLSVSRIVIDPGHGGHDPGAKGKGGITEAELVLDVSLRLEKLLEKVPGVAVILTRHTDDFVALPERTAIANREGADLFLSIHANASPNDQAHGVETYFLNFANNLSAAAVAARENATSGQAMGALPDFVRAIALNNKLDESRDFATLVQQTLVERLGAANKGVKDLGVKQAPFVVLIGASMPSVLAEISFLTHEQEAKLLKNGPYRQRIAEALFDAVRQYQGSLTSVQTVAHQ